MKRVDAGGLFRRLIPLLLIAAAEAGAMNVGDFQRLENWAGLTATDLQGPYGGVAARLACPGEASFTYTKPKTYLSGEQPGFSDMLDQVAVGDWYDFRYLEFDLRLPDENPVELTCTLRPLKIGRPDYMDALSSKMTVQGKGWHPVIFSLRDFDYIHHQGTFWKYIQRLTLSVSGGREPLLISQPRLKKSRAVALSAPVESKPAKAGETVSYKLQLENESAVPRQVTLLLEHTGWEACPAQLSETALTLQPGEARTVRLSVAMNEQVA